MQNFHDFVGQTRVVKHVRRLVDGARRLETAFPPSLIVGPSGFGKSSLAISIAHSLGANLRSLMASDDTSTAVLRAELESLECGDVLLIDEAHALSADAQQVLFQALDEGKIQVAKSCKRPADEAGGGHTTTSLAPFTLIAATNQPGRLQKALRSRLIELAFDHYRLTELREIARRIGEKTGIELTGQASGALARVAQGSPRRIALRIDALRIFFPHQNQLGAPNVVEYLASEGFDVETGLGVMQRAYLATLARQQERSLALEQIACALGVDLKFLRTEIEPFLVSEGLIDFHGASRRRSITTEGAARLRRFRSNDAATSTEPERMETLEMGVTVQ